MWEVIFFFNTGIGFEVLILRRFDIEELGEGYEKLVKDLKERKGKKLY